MGLLTLIFNIARSVTKPIFVPPPNFRMVNSGKDLNRNVLSF